MNWRNAHGACQPPRKRVTPSPLSAVRPKYSAMKKSAYLKPEYSVRWPAMSSLSASGKSKGERLLSASAAMRKMMKPAKPHGVKTNQCGKIPKVQKPCAAAMSLVESVPVTSTTGTTESSSGSS